MVENKFVTDYLKNGWNLNKGEFEKLTAYERSFIELELGQYKTKEFYESRLRMINFNDMDKILDAGCGIGQWSIAMAELNKKVCGIDAMPSRINCAIDLAKNMEKQNIEFEVGNLESLPYKDNSFDAVFCYGVFMFTDTEKCLSEFHRVLKPGGTLYFNFNSLGWYAHLIIDRGIKMRNLNIIIQAIRMILRYLIGCTKQILIRESWMVNQLKKYGFNDIHTAIEGNLTPGLQYNQIKPKSIYQGYHYGMRSIIEVLAKK